MLIPELSTPKRVFNTVQRMCLTARIITMPFSNVFLLYFRMFFQNREFAAASFHMTFLTRSKAELW